MVRSVLPPWLVMDYLDCLRMGWREANKVSGALYGALLVRRERDRRAIPGRARRRPRVPQVVV